MSDELAVLSAAWHRLADEMAAAEAELAGAELEPIHGLLAAKRDELDSAARAERAHEDEALKQLVLAPLPSELVRLVFLLLPVDARLRSREVCRGWRAFLADTRLWQVCDLSATSGVLAPHTHALLQAACARAQGTLEVLDVTSWRGVFNHKEALLQVLRSNARSLLELRAWDTFIPLSSKLGVDDVDALLAAAPRLRALQCDAGAHAEEAPSALCLLQQPRYSRVHLQALCLYPRVEFLDVPAAAATIARHPSLVRLEVVGEPLDDAASLDALAELAIAQLFHLIMIGCQLSPASLPALTRLLRFGVLLAELEIVNSDAPMLAGEGVPAFCAALRASRLIALRLHSMRLWERAEEGLALLAACRGHPTLRLLCLYGNGIEATQAPERAAIEAALEGLVAEGLRVFSRAIERA